MRRHPPPWLVVLFLVILSWLVVGGIVYGLAQLAGKLVAS